MGSSLGFFGWKGLPSPPPPPPDIPGRLMEICELQDAVSQLGRFVCEVEHELRGSGS